MIFEQALRVFGLSSLVGGTDKSLAKQYRKLAKERHPDSNNKTEYDFIETQEAYNVLQVELSKGHLEVAPGIRLKPLRKMLLRQYMSEVAKHKHEFLSFIDKNSIKLDLFLSVTLTDLAESTVYLTETKRFIRDATAVNVYTIRIMLNFDSTKRLRVRLLDGFETYVDLYSSFTCVSVPIDIPDTVLRMKFDLMVINSKTEGVVVA